jgi:hypothetical protein
MMFLLELTKKELLVHMANINLNQLDGTLTNYVNVHSTKLATLKTREQLLEFLEDGLNTAVKSKHMTVAAKDKYLADAQVLTVKKLQMMIYNISLAGENLKTIKI